MRRIPLLLLIAAMPASLALTFCTGDDPIVLDSPTEGGPAPAPDAGTDAPEGPKPIVLGQPDEYSVLENELGLFVPTGVAIHEGKLVVVDANAQRAIIWNAIPTTNLKHPDLVIGRSTLTNTAGNLPISAATMFVGQFCDGIHITSTGRLFIADTNRHRVLGWNVIPTTNNRSADLVLGNTSFDTAPGAQAYLPPSQSTMAHACSVSSDATHLFVADHTNRRVLIWDSIPTTSGTLPKYVLGQKSFTSNDPTLPDGGIGTDCLADGAADHAACINIASSVHADGTGLWVADFGHHRVLHWNSVPTKDYAPADLVLGQADFDGGNNGIGPNRLSGPRKIITVGGKLIVADEGNHRVLIWNSIPTQNGQNADVVIGQTDFTSNSKNRGNATPDAQSLFTPFAAASDGKVLVVADRDNKRVLIWNTIPTQNGQAADVVLGRPTMTATRVRAPNGTTFDRASIETDGKRFLIGDLSRTLLWDHLPTGPNDPATLVLGMPDLTTVKDFPSGMNGTGLPSASRFHFFSGVWRDDTRLVAGDFQLGRVLIWTKPITTNNQDADLVLGQASMTAYGQNETNPPPPAQPVNPATEKRLNRPAGIASDGTHLAVADTGNNRILIWSSFPTSIQQPADIVLGQADMISREANRAGPTGANTISNPGALYWDGTRLFASDAGNNRVLVWNGWPTENGQAAAIVLGQPDFAASAPNNGERSAKSLSNPAGIAVLEGKLFIADTNNNRVLRWNAIPTSSYAPADGVYGQANFTDGSPNRNEPVGPTTLSSPTSVRATTGRLWVTDTDNRRVLGLPLQ